MVNKVILVGNVGADPEIRTFEDGSKVARINLATTERIFNPKTQERTDRTDWHRLTIWRGLATVVEQYVRKGTQLYIEGKIRNNEWTDATGQKRFGVEIHVDVLNMLGRREVGGMPQPIQQQSPQQYTQPQQEYGQQQPPQGMQQQQYQAPQQSSVPQFDDMGGDDVDDLPF